MPDRHNPEEPLLDITELAAWLNITERHVRRLVQERRIPFRRVGGRIRFVRAEIQARLDANRHGPDAA